MPTLDSITGGQYLDIGKTSGTSAVGSSSFLGGVGDFFGGLVDTATGVYSAVTDYDIGKREIELQRRYIENQAALNQARAPVLSFGGAGLSSNSLVVLGLLGAIGIGAYALLKD